jgi:hypothetical protein
MVGPKISLMRMRSFNLQAALSPSPSPPLLREWTDLNGRLQDQNNGNIGNWCARFFGACEDDGNPIECR